MQVLWTVTGIPAVTMVDRYFAVTVPFIGVDSWNILLSPCQGGIMKGGLLLCPSEGWGLISGGEGTVFGRCETCSIWLTCPAKAYRF